MNKLQKAYFAAGCFWCIQEIMDKTEGVIETTVGYMGGNVSNPSYRDVCSGKTGHAEAIEILFDSEKITFENLLGIFWKNIDPTAINQQYCDIGTQYRTAIFYCDEEQKKIAEQSKSNLEKSKTVNTEIVEKVNFYPAEDYHQKYYKKKPESYQEYHDHSGRA